MISWSSTACLSVTASYIRVPGSGKSFDDYLVSADTKMYQLKQQRKQKKDSNFLKGVDISSVPMMVDNNIQIMDREGHVCRVFDF